MTRLERQTQHAVAILFGLSLITILMSGCKVLGGNGMAKGSPIAAPEPTTLPDPAPAPSPTPVPTASLSISSFSHAFGNTSLSRLASATLILSNSGEASASIASLDLSGQAANSFEATGCVGPLAPSASCEIAVSFAPISAQEHGATLSVRFNDGAADQEIMIDLSGTGVQPGSLDSLFGENGRASSSVCKRFGDVAVQADQKMVAVGFDSTFTKFCIARFLPDGASDSSFGTNGAVVIPFDDNYLGVVSPWNAEAKAVAVQANGAIVVAGTLTEPAWNARHMAVARLTSTGALDPSFGSGGKATIDLDQNPMTGNFHRMQDMTLQNDGKIVLTGDYNSAAMAIVRLTSSGALDPDFNDDGFDVESFSGSGGLGNAVAIDSNGRIVIVGYSSWRAAIVRYNADGSLDESFDSDGIVLIDHGIYAQLYGVGFKQNGDMIVGGWSTAFDWTYQALALRIPSSGSPDLTYGSAGVFESHLGAANVFTDAKSLVLPSGEIILAGYKRNADFSHDSAIARVTASGSLDTSFHASGYDIVDRSGDGGNDILSSVVAQSSGKLIAAGYAGNEAVLYRYMQ